MKAIKLTVVFLGVILLSSFIFPGHNNNSNIIRNKKDKQIEFRIQLCSYYESVPVKEVELMREIGGVSSFKEDGKTIYITAPFASEAEAKKELPKFRAIGFAGAAQVVKHKDDLMSMEDYYQQFDIDPADDSLAPVVRIWK